MKHIILAGGIGSRLFPLSRESFPKQHLELINNSLLYDTVDRLKSYDKNSEIIIVTNEKSKFLIMNELKEFTNIKLYLEPIGRNTAPAIAYSIKNLNENDVFGIYASDHYIENTKTFFNNLRIAENNAKNGSIITFGIKPTNPETGYGYIESENFDKYNLQAIDAISFKEKPNLKLAKKYIHKGNYLWNSGMFVMQKKIFLQELEKFNNHNFQVSKDLEINRTIFDNYEIYTISDDNYMKFESISIDYAICEKSKIIKVIPSDIGWCDIGSFDALHDILINKKNKNICKNFDFLKNYHQNTIKLQTIDSNKNLVLGKSKNYCLLGVEDLIIVDTDDIQLICKKGYSQKAKNFINKFDNNISTKFHTTVQRPWGKYTNIYEKENGYKIKRIEVKPGDQLSYQSHESRAEHWVIVQGEGLFTLDDVETRVSKGYHLCIEKNQKHRIKCTSENESLIFVEVQIGNYLGEDDITRYSDDYGRLK